MKKKKESSAITTESQCEKIVESTVDEKSVLAQSESLAVVEDVVAAIPAVFSATESLADLVYLLVKVVRRESCYFKDFFFSFLENVRLPETGSSLH